MALIKCPECGKEISDKSTCCIHCGYPLADKEIDSSTTSNDDAQAIPVMKSHQEKKPKNKALINVVMAKVNKINPTIRVGISVLLIIIALVCLVQGKNSLNNDRYDFYKEHYEDCIDGYEESMDKARTSGYLFKSSYESIAEDYERMAKDDLAKLNGYRAKAAVFYLSFAILAVAAIVFLRGVDFKKAVAEMSTAAKNAFSDDLTEQPGNYLVADTSDEPPVQNDDAPPDEDTDSIAPDADDDRTAVIEENHDDSGGAKAQEATAEKGSPQKHFPKKLLIVAGAVVAVLILLALGTSIFEKEYCQVEGCDREAAEEEKYCNIHLCLYGNCSNRSIDGGMYCYSHTCKADDCDERIARGLYGEDDPDYCSDHQREYDAAISTSNLKITNKQISHNSSYTVFTATMTNEGAATYEFVTVKGSFVDEDGKVCDTDSTYAVGGEGLAPGESTTFRMSVPKDRDIKSCNVTIVDYDVEKVNTSIIFEF